MRFSTFYNFFLDHFIHFVIQTMCLKLWTFKGFYNEARWHVLGYNGYIVLQINYVPRRQLTEVDKGTTCNM